MEYVWSWGIGQENINADKLIESIKDMKDKEKEIFKMRFNFRYPIDVSKRRRKNNNKTA